MNQNVNELVTNTIAQKLIPFYGRIRNARARGLLRGRIMRMERGAFYSASIREIFKKYHGVEIGAYTYGGCFSPGFFPEKTKIGRYVSVATGVRAFAANHPVDAISMHPFFYRSDLGILDQELIDRGTLTISHDVWIGANVIITPGCSSVGIGSVIGAGSVVTKNVPPYAIVAGNPAKIIKYRFHEEKIDILIRSEWWECSIDELMKNIGLFKGSMTNTALMDLQQGLR
jgi:acetyltransferase-like isoleucine patch superfamily enzyme